MSDKLPRKLGGRGGMTRRSRRIAPPGHQARRGRVPSPPACARRLSRLLDGAMEAVGATRGRAPICAQARGLAMAMHGGGVHLIG